MSLLALWELVCSKYGAIVAGLVVVLIVLFAWYFGYTPSQVVGFFWK